MPAPDSKIPTLSGWLAGVVQLRSPNCGLRPHGARIDTVIVHSISLPPGEYGGEQVPALFMNRLDWNAHPYFQEIRGLEVSSHFFIRRTGDIWQFVSCEERAWHAGVSSWAGRDNCNDYSIGIELEGLEGSAFDPVQYTQLAALLNRLRETYPIEQVLGHEHVAPGRKFDPGPGFDWLQLQKTVAWPLQCFPVLSILKISANA
ncbi:MAG: 1,6-anhydro-N-acetylmuramyl-L-alanine amidase AmpD [Brachymonas sp.]